MGWVPQDEGHRAERRGPFFELDAALVDTEATRAALDARTADDAGRRPEPAVLLPSRRRRGDRVADRL
jgi:hypothetical protein